MRSTGTRRRGGPSRRGRRAAESAELSAAARRRLQSVLGNESSARWAEPQPDAGLVRSGRDVDPPLAPIGDDVVGGWVPAAPPGMEVPLSQRRRHDRSAALRDRLPPGLQAVSVAPTGRALVGLLLVVAVAVATTAVTAWVARPQETRPPARTAPVGRSLSSPTPSLAGASSGTATVVWVHVAGAVSRPGLVELAAGARVADAVEAAGGVTRVADPASVNLARPVVDGEQVVVARRGQPVALPAVTPSGSVAVPGAGGAPVGAPVDLNTATMEQLDGLPGIGPVLAQRILDWRVANGRFTVVDELGEVSGIGDATLADLRPLVTV